MKKTSRKLALRSDTIRTLAHGTLRRVAGGDDTTGCPMHDDPTFGGGGSGPSGPSLYPAICSIHYSDCVCGSQQPC